MANRPRIEELTEVAETDAEAIARLMPQLSSASPPEIGQLRAILAQDAVTVFVARDERGEIIGMLTLYSLTTTTGRKSGIEDVVVDEGHRGEGIGSALVRQALEHAKGLGAKAIDLTSRPSRVEANELYVRLGFQRRETNVYRFSVS